MSSAKFPLVLRAIASVLLSPIALAAKADSSLTDTSASSRISFSALGRSLLPDYGDMAIRTHVDPGGPSHDVRCPIQPFDSDAETFQYPVMETRSQRYPCRWQEPQRSDPIAEGQHFISSHLQTNNVQREGGRLYPNERTLFEGFWPSIGYVDDQTGDAKSGSSSYKQPHPKLSLRKI